MTRKYNPLFQQQAEEVFSSFTAFISVSSSNTSSIQSSSSNNMVISITWYVDTPRYNLQAGGVKSTSLVSVVTAAQWILRIAVVVECVVIVTKTKRRKKTIYNKQCVLILITGI